MSEAPASSDGSFGLLSDSQASENFRLNQLHVEELAGSNFFPHENFFSN
eukprot:UN06294